MIKYKIEKREIEEEVPESITCDICKKEFLYSNMDSQVQIQEFVRFYTLGGYDSIFGDGSSIELDMCQHCFKEKLGKYVRVGLSELDRMAIENGFCTEEQVLAEKNKLV